MHRFLELHVEDFMTRSVVTISPAATIAEAQRLFVEHDFNCLPVVRDGKLVGVLTKLDLLKAFRFRMTHVVPPYASIVAEPVRTVMTEDPATVRPDAPLTRVLEKMVNTRFRSFPVVLGDELVGIISREDVMRGLLSVARGEA
ncbi:MAG: CBS domain-containing protein [Deltaproteobacteria bacterium]|nr:CBS domain-containing protein [Deltaproteobacteria bacterium]